MYPPDAGLGRKITRKESPVFYTIFLAALRFLQVSSDNGGYVRGLAGLGKEYA